MNKNQLARAAGTSWQHIDHFERGLRAPSARSITRLSRVLGVSPGYLLGTVDQGARQTPGLEIFLNLYAPADLSDAELEWLRAAPVDPGVASPGLYLDLLHRLRTPIRINAEAPSSIAQETQGPVLEDIVPDEAEQTEEAEEVVVARPEVVEEPTGVRAKMDALLAEFDRARSEPDD